MTQDPQHNSISFGRRLANLFVASEQEGPARISPGDAMEPMLMPLPGSEDEGEEVGEEGEGSVSDDFPILYGKAGVQPDSNADALLEAFEGMAGMEESARRTGMNAMIRAMRADAQSVKTTLTHRVRVLDVVTQAQERATAERKSARAAALDGQRKETDERIEELRRQIAALEDALTRGLTEAQTADAADDSALRGLKHRVTRETERLTALARFFTPTSEE